MQRNQNFERAIKILSLVAFIFSISNSAKAESVHGKFFNGTTYSGEYLVTEGWSSDGMRVNPVTIKLKIAGEKAQLRYTHVADDLPSVKSSDMGFLSIIVKSGGMEGRVTYNYVIPVHGALTSIGAVQTDLHLGKIESIDVQPNQNISKDAIN